MARKPVSCAPATPVAEVARRCATPMCPVSGVTDGAGRLLGILTTRDLSNRVLAEGRDPSHAVSEVMTRDPMSLPPTALGSDILHLMLERKIGHLPIVENGRTGRHDHPDRPDALSGRSRRRS